MGSSMRDMGRLNSQGPSNASATGIANANQNSVLAGTTATRTATSGPLAGLATGTTLYSNGTAVGTVQQIRITGRGTVAMVVVKGTNGGFYAVPANKLTYTGGTLSTNVRLAGVDTPTTMSMSSRARLNSQGPMHASATGIAHANSHSSLAGGSGTSLTGVSVGVPLVSNGTQVGTVYRVVTANGVITRVLVQGTNGRIYSLAPSTLTASGGSVTTTTTLRGI
jgi:sporulation protein YlmC with PRC-barrel domain